MTFQIVRVGPGDSALLSSVGVITLRSYVDGGHLAADDDYATRLSDVRGRARDAELWAAVDIGDHTALGSVAFVTPGSSMAELAGEREAEFRMLSVSSAARGRGIGSALVQHCITRARALDLKGIVLSTQPSMRDAHRVYERIGFVRTPELDWKPVPSVTLMTYRLEL